MLDEKSDLAAKIRNAEKLHGHLGPFLVIGVRIASLAAKILNKDAVGKDKLQITAKLPLLTPFSCILDGIQATTHCTIGNQKLKIEGSQGQINISFGQQNSNGALRFHVNPSLVDGLRRRCEEGASNEELAWDVASIPQSQLFTIEK